MMIYVVEIEGRAIVTFPAETDIDAETFVEEEWFKDLMMKTHSGSHTSEPAADRRYGERGGARSRRIRLECGLQCRRKRFWC
jgi:hypothetical protein